mmetsp:Transcript_15450/g.24245  ORF Transcript_15450/g.24245 Transcript_15450/m.24245 type:complete len:85 (-) Transcript_15450:49-303(-)
MHRLERRDCLCPSVSRFCQRLPTGDAIDDSQCHFLSTGIPLHDEEAHHLVFGVRRRRIATKSAKKNDGLLSTHTNCTNNFEQTH